MKMADRCLLLVLNILLFKKNLSVLEDKALCSFESLGQ